MILIQMQGMKPFFVASCFLLVLSLSCQKKQEDCESFLQINKVTISPSSSVANGIIFNLEAYGGNLCFSFKRLDIVRSSDKTYDIRVIANKPCGPRICAEALYQTEQTGTIGFLTAGTYTLHFFSDNSLFTTLTVTL